MTFLEDLQWRGLIADCTAPEALGQRVGIGAVGHEAAPLEIFEEGHGRKGQRVSESPGAVNGSTPPARKSVSYP